MKKSTIQHFLWFPLRGSIAFVCYALNLFVGGSLLFVLFIVYHLAPSKKIRAKIQQAYYFLPPWWIKINRFIRRYISGIQLDKILPANLPSGNHYLLIANHQSWADILILFDSFEQTLPMLKFFLKKQLRWLPIVGQACWIYGFPFLSRHTKTQLAKHPEWKGKDFAQTRKACERFKMHPGCLVIFAEGTRFTQKKHAQQLSPYSHLLKPRAGGIALALQYMGGSLNTLLDVTIIYPKQHPTFWQYCCGSMPHIVVHTRCNEISTDLRGNYENDPLYRSHIQQFINQRWQEKQQLIDNFGQSYFSKNSPTTHYSIYHPRYWPIWGGLALLWICIQLPYRWQLQIGKGLGLIAWRFAKRERNIAKINLNKCFPHFSPLQRNNLLRQNFINIGIGLIETAFGWWAPAHRLQSLVHIEGLHYVTQALTQKKGILLCTPHMASLHIAGRLVNLHHSFGAMYFPPKNPILRYISLKSMQRYYQIAIPRYNARELIKSLKNNLAILYTPDTDAGLKNSIFAPFFNITTATVTATARFAQISGCAVIFVNYWRRDDKKGYCIQFSAPLENYPTKDEYADAQRMNQLLETAILQHPEQYLWQYKRFKTRPPGEASFYSRKKHAHTDVVSGP